MEEKEVAKTLPICEERKDQNLPNQANHPQSENTPSLRELAHNQLRMHSRQPGAELRGGPRLFSPIPQRPCYQMSPYTSPFLRFCMSNLSPINAEFVASPALPDLKKQSQSAQIDAAENSLQNSHPTTVSQ